MDERSKRAQMERKRRIRRKKQRRRVLISALVEVLILAVLALAFCWDRGLSAKVSGVLGIFDRPPATELDVSGVNSSNVLLMDVKSGKVIGNLNGEERIYPASMTKIMTAVVGLENLSDQNETITIDRETYDRLYTEGASLAGFGAGDEVKAIDILYGVMLPSGAECCVGLAQHLFESEENFVAKMNEKAAELGMDSTHFVTCTGLHDENHYTTVRDLTKLLSYALQNDTFRQIYCTSEYTTSATASAPEGLHFLSTMFKKMDSPEVNGGEIEGGKTGYTGEAGQCLASLAKVDDVEYILVTAGAPGGPSTEPYHIEDAKAVYNRIQAGEQGSAADTAADSQDDQAMTETDGAA